MYSWTDSISTHLMKDLHCVLGQPRLGIGIDNSAKHSRIDAQIAMSIEQSS